MAKHICFKIIIAFMLSGLWLGHGDTPALAADVKFSKGSTLEGILKRGELRIGLEVGYMPFEMIDKRSGLAPEGDPARGPSTQGSSTQFDGF
jgi:polar amino acid transport system substrate-binding protein